MSNSPHPDRQPPAAKPPHDPAPPPHKQPRPPIAPWQYLFWLALLILVPLLGYYSRHGRKQVTVLTQTEKDTAFITVYDDMGSVIYTWSSGRRVIDINFCDDGKGCCISTISSSGGKIDSAVYSVMFDSREPVMTCTLEDSFVLRTQKLSSGGYIMVCDNCVIGVDGNGNQTGRFDFKDQPVSFGNSEKYTVLYTKAVTGTHGTLMIFDNNSGSVQPTVTQDIQGEPRKVQLDGSTVIAFSDKFVESYDVDGSKLATAQVSRNYVDCVYANKAVYLMGYRDINKIKFDT